MSRPLADFVDRTRAIDQLIKDDETPIVYLEFTPQGKWRGVSYYIASGNGCAYCTTEATSSVQLVKGRLTGVVKNAEKDRSRACCHQAIWKCSHARRRATTSPVTCRISRKNIR